MGKLQQLQLVSRQKVWRNSFLIWHSWAKRQICLLNQKDGLPPVELLVDFLQGHCAQQVGHHTQCTSMDWLIMNILNVTIQSFLTSVSHTHVRNCMVHHRDRLAVWGWHICHGPHSCFHNYPIIRPQLQQHTVCPFHRNCVKVMHNRGHN